MARLWRYGLVLSRRRDIADDLVQSTCVRALERSAQFQPGSRVDHWLFAILHSIWVNELRAQRVRQGQGFVDIDQLDSVPSEWAEPESTHQANQLMQQVNQLPEAQRNTVFLVYVEGFTYQEAAQTLAIPIGTVMSRLAAARAMLAKYSGQPQQGERYER